MPLALPLASRVAQVFLDMTDWARHVTGYSNFTFLNKPIVAPTISHELKTASFNPASFVDMGDAGLDSLLTYINRHFASLFGRAPAPPPTLPANRHRHI